MGGEHMEDIFYLWNERLKTDGKWEIFIRGMWVWKMTGNEAFFTRGMWVWKMTGNEAF